MALVVALGLYELSLETRNWQIFGWSKSVHIDLEDRFLQNNALGDTKLSSVAPKLRKNQKKGFLCRKNYPILNQKSKIPHTGDTNSLDECE